MYNVIVLMSTYNGEKYLREQLDSILHQVDVNISVLIRDDGSNDDTLKIINEYKNKFSNISLIQGRNLGPCQSFFELLYNQENSKYDFVCVSDQDDVWYKDKIISAILKIGVCDAPTLYYSAITRWDMLTGTKSDYIARIQYSFEESLFKSQFAGCTMVLNKAGIEFLQSFDKVDIAVMHDQYLYQLFKGCNQRVVYDPNSHIDYRIHGSNVSVVGQSIKSELKHNFTILRKQKGFRKACARELMDKISFALEQDNRKYLEKLAHYNKLRNKVYVISSIKNFKYEEKEKKKAFFSILLGLY